MQHYRENSTTQWCRIRASALVREFLPLDVLDFSVGRVVHVVSFLDEGCQTGGQKLSVLETWLSVCLHWHRLLFLIIIIVQTCSWSLLRHGCWHSSHTPAYTCYCRALRHAAHAANVNLGMWWAADCTTAVYDQRRRKVSPSSAQSLKAWPAVGRAGATHICWIRWENVCGCLYLEYITDI